MIGLLMPCFKKALMISGVALCSLRKFYLAGVVPLPILVALNSPTSPPAR